MCMKWLCLLALLVRVPENGSQNTVFSMVKVDNWLVVSNYRIPDNKTTLQRTSKSSCACQATCAAVVGCHIYAWYQEDDDIICQLTNVKNPFRFHESSNSFYAIQVPENTFVGENTAIAYWGPQSNATFEKAVTECRSKLDAGFVLGSFQTPEKMKALRHFYGISENVTGVWVNLRKDLTDNLLKWGDGSVYNEDYLANINEEPVVGYEHNQWVTIEGFMPVIPSTAPEPEPQYFFLCERDPAGRTNAAAIGTVE